MCATEREIPIARKGLKKVVAVDPLFGVSRQCVVGNEKSERETREIYCSIKKYCLEVC